MKNKTNGFSLIEILVVIVIFAILSVVGTQIVTTSLRSSTKSEKLVAVRENVDFAFNVMERELRNAKSISCPSKSTVNFTNQDNSVSSLSCVGGVNGRIELNTLSLISGNTYVDCTANVFTCSVSSVGIPALDINIKAYDADNLAIEGAEVSTSTKIILRSY